MNHPRYPLLCAPVDVGGLRLPHRLVMGSMHLNRETGGADELAAFYVARVLGGAALIVTGGCAVSPVGAGGPGYALAGEPAHAARWRRVVDAVHAAGGLIALQLFHAGRYALLDGVEPVAPSPVYSRFSRCVPAVLDGTGIADTLGDFARAAEWATGLGFDAVEVMASEGYLVNQFASPVTNQRDDAWGGDAERRRAFPTGVVRAVRAATDRPVVVRMSGDDLMPGAPGPEEVDALAAAYVDAGADALAVGIGWHESPTPTVQSLVGHGAFTPVAGRIRASLAAAGRPVPVIASNRLNSLARAEATLAAGDGDLVAMARPFLADPAIVTKSLAGDESLVNTCIGCNQACIDRSLGEAPVSCLVNPRAGQEALLGVDGNLPARSGRSPRVAVVGAGPAGMEAARAAAAAGARVTLFEATDRIGGQFRLASRVPGKEDFAETIRYFEHELARLGVTVRIGAGVSDAADLDGFDRVVVATGVHPRAITLPGPGHPHLLDYVRAFADLGSVGSRVAVVGAGGVAVDLAHLLAGQRGRRITIMRRSGPVGAGIGVSTRWAVLAELRGAGVRTLTGVRYLSLEPGGLRIRTDEGPELVRADSVVVAAGQQPRRAVADLLAPTGTPYAVVGGAADTRGLNAVRAFAQGLEAGLAAAAQCSS
ncbi:MAG: FAD-dependent oxidoreductase [Marmoricola sp.]